MVTIFKSVIGALLILILIGLLNHQGVGLACAKYYSDEEITVLAVKYVFEEFSGYSKVADLEYVDADEYLQLVRNCCSVDFGQGAGSSEPIYRLTGQLSGYVWIPAIAKSLVVGKTDGDIKAAIRTLKDRQYFYIGVSNCGKAWDPFD